MKVVALGIEMICHFSKDGVRPLKFRYQEGNSYKIIKVDKIISMNTEKVCGNIALIFDCQSVIDGIERLYQIKYIVEDINGYYLKYKRGGIYKT